MSDRGTLQRSPRSMNAQDAVKPRCLTCSPSLYFRLFLLFVGHMHFHHWVYENFPTSECVAQGVVYKVIGP